MSPALAGGFCTTDPPEKPAYILCLCSSSMSWKLLIQFQVIDVKPGNICMMTKDKIIFTNGFAFNKGYSYLPGDVSGFHKWRMCGCVGGVMPVTFSG